MLFFVLLSLVVARTIQALPGGHFDSRQQTLPVIELPYGTWQAASYDAESDVRNLSVAVHCTKAFRFINSPTFVLQLHQSET
jgi:hypothetical protein